MISKRLDLEGTSIGDTSNPAPHSPVQFNHLEARLPYEDEPLVVWEDFYIPYSHIRFISTDFLKQRPTILGEQVSSPGASCIYRGDVPVYLRGPGLRQVRKPRDDKRSKSPSPSQY